VRTYYFNAEHHRGHPTIFLNNMHHYTEVVMATKQEMNQYFTENYYKSIIGVLKEYN